MCETNPATSYRISRIHLQHPVVSIRNHIPPIIPAFYSRKLFTLACPIHLLFFSSHLFPRAGFGWSCFTVRFFFFAAIGLRSGSCFTGQLPGIGTVFILASLQMCKVQGKVQINEGVVGWGLWGLGGVVQGGH